MIHVFDRGVLVSGGTHFHSEVMHELATHRMRVRAQQAGVTECENQHWFIISHFLVAPVVVRV